MAGCDAEFFFEPRFCGPPGTVDGGFPCGALAELCGAAAEVTLHRAPDDGPPAGTTALLGRMTASVAARTLRTTVPRPALGRTAGAAS